MCLICGLIEPCNLTACQHETLSSPLSSTRGLSVETPPATVFRVGCYFTNGQGGLRSANLGSIPAEPFNHQVSRLLEDDRTIDELQDRVETKSRLGEVLVRLFVRLGRHDPVTLITLSLAPASELPLDSVSYRASVCAPA